VLVLRIDKQYYLTSILLVLKNNESEISIYFFNIVGRVSDEYAAILYHTFLNTNTILVRYMLKVNNILQCWYCSSTKNGQRILTEKYFCY
jgi:hypothetical protein